MTSAPWTDLGGGVLVRRSVAFQMSSVALLHPEHAVLVDPGVLASELDDFAARVAGERPRAITLLFTHAHWDHVLGRPWWPRAETVAHDRFAEVVRREEKAIAGEIEALAASHGERWERGFAAFRPTHAVSGLHFFRRGPWTLVLRDAYGHSDSQLSIHLPHARTLLAADMLSDIEIPTLDGPCAPYLRTLRDLAPLAEHGAIETLVPGHGSIARGRDEVMERMRRDIRYLEELERATAGLKRERVSKEEALSRLATMEYGGQAMPDWATKEHRWNVELLMGS
jgi:hydroxyacylglutathione hydrolase